MSLAVELYLLKISPLRPPTPLPWPTAQGIALAKQLGFVEPVTVRSIPNTHPPCYEILAGLRHWLLAQRAQLPTVPVHLLEHLSEAEARLLVNQDLESSVPDPIAEAQALQSLVDHGRSVAAAGREVGRTRTDASHLLRLLQLCLPVQALVTAGELAPGKARTLVGLPEHQQREAARQIVQKRLNTRHAEALARAYKAGMPSDGVRPVTDRPTLPAHDPNTRRLENELAELLGTRVTIQTNANWQGQLTIDFDNLEILDGVLEKMGYQS